MRANSPAERTVITKADTMVEVAELVKTIKTWMGEKSVKKLRLKAGGSHIVSWKASIDSECRCKGRWFLWGVNKWRNDMKELCFRRCAVLRMSGSSCPSSSSSESKVLSTLTRETLGDFGVKMEGDGWNIS